LAIGIAEWRFDWLLADLRFSLAIADYKDAPIANGQSPMGNRQWAIANDQSAIDNPNLHSTIDTS
jgi:hypothetical protein